MHIEEKKWYTVEDVAKLTGLTGRTIRNYLKNGTLTGKKIGVQWRFDEADIEKLFQDSEQLMKKPEKNPLAEQFLDTYHVLRPAVCTVIDFPEDSKREVERICSLMEEKAHEYAAAKEFAYDALYIEEKGVVRFTLTGSLTQLEDMLSILHM